MDDIKIGAVVLAAGLSSRMKGPNKMLLDYDAHSVIYTTVKHVLSSGVKRTIVVVGNGFERISEEISPLVDRDQIIFNPDYEQGMTTSIQAGIKNTSGCDGIMVCLGDMPFLNPGDYDDLIHHFTLSYQNDKMAISVPFKDRKRGNPVIFSSYYSDLILSHEELNGCRGVIKSNPDHVFEFTASDAFVTDLDTPEDYQRLVKQDK
jgi:molybdenum cofactor cytidylyltransferase